MPQSAMMGWVLWLLQLAVGSSSHPPYWMMSLYPWGSITEMCLQKLCQVREVVEMSLLGLKRKGESRMPFQSRGECYGRECPSATVKMAEEILPQQGEWLYNGAVRREIVCSWSLVTTYCVLVIFLSCTKGHLCKSWSPDSPFPPGSLKSLAFQRGVQARCVWEGRGQCSLFSLGHAELLFSSAALEAGFFLIRGDVEHALLGSWPTYPKIAVLEMGNCLLRISANIQRLISSEISVSLPFWQLGWHNTEESTDLKATREGLSSEENPDLCFMPVSIVDSKI